MAEERSNLISPENLPTVSAVGFILGLLAFVMALWGKFDAIRLGASIKMVLGDSVKTGKLAEGHEAKIADLEKRLAALEAGAAAPAATEAAPAATEAAPAAEGAK